jgi:hypothetical protein
LNQGGELPLDRWIPPTTSTEARRGSAAGDDPPVVGAHEGAQNLDLVEPALGQVIEHSELPVLQSGRLGTYEQLVARNVPTLSEGLAHDPSGIA